MAFSFLRELRLETVLRTLRVVVTLALAVAVAGELVELSRMLRSGFGAGSAVVVPQEVDVPKQPPSAPADRPIFAELAAAHLFGEAPRAPAPRAVEAVVDAPDTTLSLTLTGILFGQGGAPSTAIIGSKTGGERNYASGEPVDRADDATVSAIYVDRVILDRGDHFETLRPPKVQASPRGPAATLASAQAPPEAVEPAPPPPAQRRRGNTSVLAQVVQVSPSYDEDRFAGFVASPGSNEKAFKAVGLQEGDVVTMVNGEPLDDPDPGALFKAVGEGTMANVTVLRAGLPMSVPIDLSRLPDDKN